MLIELRINSARNSIPKHVLVESRDRDSVARIILDTAGQPVDGFNAAAICFSGYRWRHISRKYLEFRCSPMPRPLKIRALTTCRLYLTIVENELPPCASALI